MISVALDIRLPWRREKLVLSLPENAALKDALVAADISDHLELVFVVRANCMLHADDMLANDDVLLVLPAMLGG